MTSASPRLHGGCHCGALTLVFATSFIPEETAPRACDCSFCRAHGAAWVSDPAGRLVIHATRANRLRSYRQGSLAARFQLCCECGVLIAVTYEDGDRRFAAVNVRCL